MENKYRTQYVAEVLDPGYDCGEDRSGNEPTRHRVSPRASSKLIVDVRDPGYDCAAVTVMKFSEASSGGNPELKSSRRVDRPLKDQGEPQNRLKRTRSLNLARIKTSDDFIDTSSPVLKRHTLTKRMSLNALGFKESFLQERKTPKTDKKNKITRKPPESKAIAGATMEIQAKDICQAQGGKTLSNDSAPGISDVIDFQGHHRPREDETQLRSRIGATEASERSEKFMVEKENLDETLVLEGDSFENDKDSPIVRTPFRRVSKSRSYSESDVGAFPTPENARIRSPTFSQLEIDDIHALQLAISEALEKYFSTIDPNVDLRKEYILKQEINGVEVEIPLYRGTSDESSCDSSCEDDNVSLITLHVADRQRTSSTPYSVTISTEIVPKSSSKMKFISVGRYFEPIKKREVERKRSVRVDVKGPSMNFLLEDMDAVSEQPKSDFLPKANVSPLMLSAEETSRTVSNEQELVHHRGDHDDSFHGQVNPTRSLRKKNSDLTHEGSYVMQSVLEANDSNLAIAYSSNSSRMEKSTEAASGGHRFSTKPNVAVKKRSHSMQQRSALFEGRAETKRGFQRNLLSQAIMIAIKSEEKALKERRKLFQEKRKIFEEANCGFPYSLSLYLRRRSLPGSVSVLNSPVVKRRRSESAKESTTYFKDFKGLNSERSHSVDMLDGCHERSQSSKKHSDAKYVTKLATSADVGGTLSPSMLRKAVFCNPPLLHPELPCGEKRQLGANQGLSNLKSNIVPSAQQTLGANSSHTACGSIDEVQLADKDNQARAKQKAAFKTETRNVRSRRLSQRLKDLCTIYEKAPDFPADGSPLLENVTHSGETVEARLINFRSDGSIDNSSNTLDESTNDTLNENAEDEAHCHVFPARHDDSEDRGWEQGLELKKESNFKPMSTACSDKMPIGGIKEGLLMTNTSTSLKTPHQTCTPLSASSIEQNTDIDEEEVLRRYAEIAAKDTEMLIFEIKGSGFKSCPKSDTDKVLARDANVKPTAETIPKPNPNPSKVAPSTMNNYSSRKQGLTDPVDKLLLNEGKDIENDLLTREISLSSQINPLTNEQPILPGKMDIVPTVTSIQLNRKSSNREATCRILSCKLNNKDTSSVHAEPSIEGSQGYSLSHTPSDKVLGELEDCAPQTDDFSCNKTELSLRSLSKNEERNVENRTAFILGSSVSESCSSENGKEFQSKLSFDPSGGIGEPTSGFLTASRMLSDRLKCGSGGDAVTADFLNLERSKVFADSLWLPLDFEVDNGKDAFEESSDSERENTENLVPAVEYRRFKLPSLSEEEAGTDGCECTVDSLVVINKQSKQEHLPSDSESQQFKVLHSDLSCRSSQNFVEGTFSINGLIAKEHECTTVEFNRENKGKDDEIETEMRTFRSEFSSSPRRLRKTFVNEITLEMPFLKGIHPSHPKNESALYTVRPEIELQENFSELMRSPAADEDRSDYVRRSSVVSHVYHCIQDTPIAGSKKHSAAPANGVTELQENEIGNDQVCEVFENTSLDSPTENELMTRARSNVIEYEDESLLKPVLNLRVDSRCTEVEGIATGADLNECFWSNGSILPEPTSLTVDNSQSFDGEIGNLGEMTGTLVLVRSNSDNKTSPSTVNDAGTESISSVSCATSSDTATAAKTVHISLNNSSGNSYDLDSETNHAGKELVLEIVSSGHFSDSKTLCKPDTVRTSQGLSLDKTAASNSMTSFESHKRKETYDLLTSIIGASENSVTSSCHAQPSAISALVQNQGNFTVDCIFQGATGSPAEDRSMSTRICELASIIEEDFSGSKNGLCSIEHYEETCLNCALMEHSLLSPNIECKKVIPSAEKGEESEHERLYSEQPVELLNSVVGQVGHEEQLKPPDALSALKPVFKTEEGSLSHDISSEESSCGCNALYLRLQNASTGRITSQEGLCITCVGDASVKQSSTSVSCSRIEFTQASKDSSEGEYVYRQEESHSYASEILLQDSENPECGVKPTGQSDEVCSTEKAISILLRRQSHEALLANHELHVDSLSDDSTDISTAGNKLLREIFSNENKFEFDPHSSEADPYQGSTTTDTLALLAVQLPADSLDHATEPNSFQCVTPSRISLNSTSLDFDNVECAKASDSPRAAENPMLDLTPILDKRIGHFSSSGKGELDKNFFSTQSTSDAIGLYSQDTKIHLSSNNGDLHNIVMRDYVACLYDSDSNTVATTQALGQVSDFLSPSNDVKHDGTTSENVCLNYISATGSQGNGDNCMSLLVPMLEEADEHVALELRPSDDLLDPVAVACDPDVKMPYWDRVVSPIDNKIHIGESTPAHLGKICTPSTGDVDLGSNGCQHPEQNCSRDAEAVSINSTEEETICISELQNSMETIELPESNDLYESIEGVSQANIHSHYLGDAASIVAEDLMGTCLLDAFEGFLRYSHLSAEARIRSKSPIDNLEVLPEEDIIKTNKDNPKILHFDQEYPQSDIKGSSSMLAMNSLFSEVDPNSSHKTNMLQYAVMSTKDSANFREPSDSWETRDFQCDLLSRSDPNFLRDEEKDHAKKENVVGRHTGELAHCAENKCQGNIIDAVFTQPTCPSASDCLQEVTLCDLETFNVIRSLSKIGESLSSESEFNESAPSTSLVAHSPTWQRCELMSKVRSSRDQAGPNAAEFPESIEHAQGLINNAYVQMESVCSKENILKGGFTQNIENSTSSRDCFSASFDCVDNQQGTHSTFSSQSKVGSENAKHPNMAGECIENSFNAKILRQDLTLLRPDLVLHEGGATALNGLAKEQSSSGISFVYRHIESFGSVGPDEPFKNSNECSADFARLRAGSNNIFESINFIRDLAPVTGHVTERSIESADNEYDIRNDVVDVRTSANESSLGSGEHPSHLDESYSNMDPACTDMGVFLKTMKTLSSFEIMTFPPDGSTESLDEFGNALTDKARIINSSYHECTKGSNCNEHAEGFPCATDHCFECFASERNMNPAQYEFAGHDTQATGATTFATKNELLKSTEIILSNIFAGEDRGVQNHVIEYAEDPSCAIKDRKSAKIAPSKILTPDDQEFAEVTSCGTETTFLKSAKEVLNAKAFLNGQEFESQDTECNGVTFCGTESVLEKSDGVALATILSKDNQEVASHDNEFSEDTSCGTERIRGESAKVPLLSPHLQELPGPKTELTEVASSASDSVLVNSERIALGTILYSYDYTVASPDAEYNKVNSCSIQDVLGKSAGIPLSLFPALNRQETESHDSKFAQVTSCDGEIELEKSTVFEFSKKFSTDDQKVQRYDSEYPEVTFIGSENVFEKSIEIPLVSADNQEVEGHDTEYTEATLCGTESVLGNAGGIGLGAILYSEDGVVASHDSDNEVKSCGIQDVLGKSADTPLSTFLALNRQETESHDSKCAQGTSCDGETELEKSTVFEFSKNVSPGYQEVQRQDSEYTEVTFSGTESVLEKSIEIPHVIPDNQEVQGHDTEYPEVTSRGTEEFLQKLAKMAVIKIRSSDDQKVANEEIDCNEGIPYNAEYAEAKGNLLDSHFEILPRDDHVKVPSHCIDRVDYVLLHDQSSSSQVGTIWREINTANEPDIHQSRQNPTVSKPSSKRKANMGDEEIPGEDLRVINSKNIATSSSASDDTWAVTGAQPFCLEFSELPFVSAHGQPGKPSATNGMFLDSPELPSLSKTEPDCLSAGENAVARVWKLPSFSQPDDAVIGVQGATKSSRCHEDVTSEVEFCNTTLYLIHEVFDAENVSLPYPALEKESVSLGGATSADFVEQKSSNWSDGPKNHFIDSHYKDLFGTQQLKVSGKISSGSPQGNSGLFKVTSGAGSQPQLQENIAEKESLPHFTLPTVRGNPLQRDNSYVSDCKVAYSDINEDHSLSFISVSNLQPGERLLEETWSALPTSQTVDCFRNPSVDDLTPVATSFHHGQFSSSEIPFTYPFCSSASKVSNQLLIFDTDPDAFDRRESIADAEESINMKLFMSEVRCVLQRSKELFARSVMFLYPNELREQSVSRWMSSLEIAHSNPRVESRVYITVIRLDSSQEPLLEKRSTFAIPKSWLHQKDSEDPVEKKTVSLRPHIIQQPMFQASTLMPRELPHLTIHIPLDTERKLKILKTQNRTGPAALSLHVIRDPRATARFETQITEYVRELEGTRHSCIDDWVLVNCTDKEAEIFELIMRQLVRRRTEAKTRKDWELVRFDDCEIQLFESTIREMDAEHAEPISKSEEPKEDMTRNTKRKGICSVQ